MNKLKNKRVLIFQQRRWALTIGHFLAQKLQQEGCRLAAVTLKRSSHEFLINQKEVKYDLILNNDEIMSRPKDYLKGDRFSLEEICQSLDIDSIWPMVASLRNHVRSYKDKYYYGFKQNVPDEEIIDYIMAAYKYIKYFFDQFKPDVILSPNFVALPHIMFNLYAKKRGIKMMAVTDCKVRGVYILTFDYQDNEGPFYDQVDALNARKIDSPNREKAKQYIKEFRQAFKQPDYSERLANKKSLYKKIRHELSPYRKIWLYYFKPPINVLESTGITRDCRTPKILLRDHYCHKINKRHMDNYKYYPFSRLGKFVYFPLQFQPEATIDVAAPFFSNQIEIARQVAMSLPDDYTLVVKEHPQMVGLRTRSYIDKIARTVNIKLIDYRIPTEEVIKKADLIISPNSTTIAEAAFYVKPAIQLGDLGTTLRLPNVFRHTNMVTLANKIKEVLATDLNTDEYERKLENYVAAAYDTGLNFDYVSAWEKKDTKNLSKLWDIYKKTIIKHCTFDN